MREGRVKARGGGQGAEGAVSDAWAHSTRAEAYCTAKGRDTDMSHRTEGWKRVVEVPNGLSGHTRETFLKKSELFRASH